MSEQYSPEETRVIKEYVETGRRLLRESSAGSGPKNFLRSVFTGKFPQWFAQQVEGGHKEAEAMGWFRKARRTAREIRQIHDRFPA